MEKPFDLYKELESLKQENLKLKKQLAISSTTIYKQDSIISGINVGTWNWNIQTGEVSFNAAWFEMLGYSETEFGTTDIKTWEKLAHPDDLQKSEEMLKNHFSGESEFYECEVRLKHKNGDWIWVLDKGKVYEFDESGNPLLMAGSHINVNEIKQKELKSKSEMELWLSMFEYNSSVMLLIDPITGNITDANISAANFYGYPLKQILSMSINDFIDNSDNIREKTFYENKRKLFKHKLANGDLRDVEMYLTPIFLENKELIFAIIYDVTEKINAEHELKKSELKYKSIIQTAIDGFIIVDAKGKILESNEAYANMLGYTIDEILKINIMDINFRFNKANLESESNNLKQKGFTRYITQHRHKDGKLIDVEVSVKYNDFIEGDVFFVFVNDISDRILSNKKLEMMHENYDKFFNTIDEFLFVLDENGVILHTNESVVKRLGYLKEELIGKSVLSIHSVEDREEAVRIITGMLKGEIDFCPLPLVKKNGIKIPVETRVTKGVWDGENVIFGVSKDISLLKLSEEKFSKSFQINPVACGFSDIVTGEYVEVNDAFCKLFDYEINEVIGKTAFELGIIDEETRNSIFTKYSFNEKILNEEAKLKNKNGETKCVLLSAENIFLYDRSLRFTAVYDITDLKKVNEELKSINEELIKSKQLVESAYEENTKFIEELSETQAKLEKINAEKDKLFSIIAHDLRSPFQGFLGMTEILSSSLSDFTNTELQEIFIETNKTAQKIFDLLNNLLEWAKMQRGLIKYEPEKLDVNDIVNTNISLLSHNIIEKEIIIEMLNGDNNFAFVDEKMLNAVIRNLLTNAIKFTRKQGKIIIETKNLAENKIQISISDNGIGIPEYLMEKIFSVGEKVGRRGTEGEESSGLGLLICKEFVEINGGTIWVKSIEGEGTTFSFTVNTA
jgi:PAS domain S-box-containing protein